MTDVPDLGAIRAAREAAGLPSEPPPGVPLGALFGNQFQPQPFQYTILPALGPDGKTPVVYLIIEHAHGRDCYAMSQTEAEGMGRTLVEKSRLTVPS